MKTIGNYVGGVICPPVDGEYLDSVEPATGEVWARVPDGTEGDVEKAVRAADAAFPDWSGMMAAERSGYLEAIADGIEARLDEFARAESTDNGKPLRLARTIDIPRAVSNFRFFASAIKHEATEAHQTDRRALNVTIRRPRGVAGLISPWNLPLYLLTWKIAPALATGNTAVAKPSELTAMTAHLLAEVCVDVGLPSGVLNLVHGRGETVGAAIVRHPDVPTISFTGGTETGAEIARVAGPMFKKVALELGGKNPTIVFGDTDLDEVVPEAIRAAFTNQGQVCLAGSRIFVEERVYDLFVEQFVEATRELVIGDPREESTDQGALVSAAHRDKVLSYIEIAREEGVLRTGGGIPDDLPARCQSGFFVEPTVITDVAPDSRVMQEEIFGPVCTITPFRGEAEAVALANDTAYGLSASLWTRDLDRANRVAAALEVGTVWVNCWMLRDLRVPFGGTKQSGVGREGGREAIRFFTEPTNVCYRLR